MKIELTTKQYRRLLDIVYIGNWILNSARGNDRIPDFDEVESKIFSYCKEMDMNALTENVDGHFVPSQAFSEGGIHEAIMDYEDAVFYGILAEELAHRDLYFEENPLDSLALAARTQSYISEFEANGLNNVSVDAEI